MKILLTEDEYAYARSEALRRKQSGDERNLNHASTYRRGDDERIIQETGGCCAELAIRKVLGEELALPFDTFHDVPDVPPDWEVRHTRFAHGKLIVRDNDPGERRYVLVTGSPRTMEIRGWLYGREAKQDKYKWNPHGYRECWGVPQRELRSAEMLLDFRENAD